MILISIKRKMPYIQPYKKQWHLLLIALPLMLMVLLFSYVPLFGWILSLYEYRAGTPILENQFVGIKYYSLIFSDRDLLRVLKNTLIFALSGFALQPLPMIFAILLNEIRARSYKRIVQTITTLPHFISWIIVYSVMFSVLSRDGVLNEVLMGAGIITNPTNVLSDPKAVYWFHIVLYRWKEIGWSSIIYIAALTSIDQHLYEAAQIDGAGRFRMAIYVTLPGLVPTFLVLLLLSVANFVSVGFDQFFVFKNALVYNQIEVLDLYTYRVGLQQFDYSYAITVGILKSAISLMLLFSVNALAKRIRGSSIV